VRAHPYRWGAVAWLLTLQFFVLETVAQLRSRVAYSRSADTISALGTAASPGHAAMNASFVVQGVLIAAGVVLLDRALLGAARRAVEVLLGLAAVGVVVVGLAPQDAQHGLHVIGAVLYLAGGSLGLGALAYAVRPRSEFVGTVLAGLGVVATAMTVFFVTGVTHFLGTGGTERAAAYPLPVGLALAGATIWRLAGSGPAADAVAARTPGRREQREAARAERARIARERDAALEAAAALHAAAARPAPPLEQPLEQAAGPDDLDPDDPWAAPRRRAE
jgi:hypothetical membrane protein